MLVFISRIAAADPEPTAAAILAANHAAVGQLPSSGQLRIDYVITESGLTGSRTDHIDVSRGAYVTTEQVGPIGDATGYDGEVPWQRDISGANTPQRGGDRIQVAVNAAYRFANLWWKPDWGGASVTYAGRETADARDLDHVVIIPKGGKRFDAWFDADTHLLARVLEDQQFFHVTETSTEYRVENGIVIPHRIVRDPGLGPSATASSTFASMRFGPAERLSYYSCPTDPPMGASIVDGASSTTVPFLLVNNHIYIQALVNGKGPYTFIVDTGGHTLLSPHLVSDAGLESVGEAVTSGAGEGHATTGFVHFDEISIGGVRLLNQVGFATEVYEKSVEGISVDGMIGFELIRRMVTRIDYGRHTLTFTDPARFKAHGIGVAVPFVFYDHLPEVNGVINDRPVRLDIDTGSRGELDILSPFAAANDLKAQYAKGTSAVTGWGVGGAARDYMVRLPSLMLGPVEMKNVVTGLSEAKGGSFSNPNVEGNVGSALLKRFVVTFDYAHEIMYLQRISPTPTDVGTFDRSGLWINATSNGFAVVDVAQGSGAALAGIAVGNVITTINGRPVRDESLSEARLLLRTLPSGSKVTLTVQDGLTSRSIVLTLHDQI